MEVEAWDSNVPQSHRLYVRSITTGQLIECNPSTIRIAATAYPLTLSVIISVPMIARLMAAHPSCVMLKAEDWPGLEKISALRRLQASGDLRRFSILTANGGLFLDFEPERGSDGSMTSYAFPDMLVELDQLHRQGQREAAHDLFRAHLPLIRFEQQPGVGLAVRKYALMRRGAIASDVQRGPRVVLTQTGREEVDFLLTRLARKDIRASSLA